MQKWEYKIEDLYFFNLFSSKSKEQGLKEEVKMLKQKKHIEKKLNEWGKDGWELIDIKITEGIPLGTQMHIPTTRGDTYYYHLKRPLND